VEVGSWMQQYNFIKLTFTSNLVTGTSLVLCF
jgi:hypothetical protein